jgi:hypothetical protein
LRIPPKGFIWRGIKLIAPFKIIRADKDEIEQKKKCIECIERKTFFCRIKPNDDAHKAEYGEGRDHQLPEKK